MSAVSAVLSPRYCKGVCVNCQSELCLRSDVEGNDVPTLVYTSTCKFLCVLLSADCQKYCCHQSGVFKDFQVNECQ